MAMVSALQHLTYSALVNEKEVYCTRPVKKKLTHHKANVLEVKFKLFLYRHRKNDQQQNQWKLDSSSTHPKIPHSKETRQLLECNHLMYTMQQLAMLRTKTRHGIMYTMATAVQTHPYTPMRTSSAKWSGNQRRCLALSLERRPSRSCRPICWIPLRLYISPLC